MLINRNDFLSILDAIRPGVARKEIVEKSTHFIFTGKQAITFNERICVCAPFKSDFACSIQAEEFTKLIKSIRADEFDMEVVEDGEKHAVKIKSSKVEAEFAVSTDESATDLVKQLKINSLPKLWKPLPEGFMAALQWCLFSASEDATQQILTCISVKKKTIASSDDMRVSLFTLLKPIDVELLIPAVSVEELVKFNASHFCVIEPWVYFKTNTDAIFCAHLVDGKYPDPSEFFSFDGADVELPGELDHALESAEIMAAGEFDIDKRIKITINDRGILTVFAENDALGWIKTKMKMEIKKAPAASFVINPIFLREILKKTHQVKIGEDRALFKADNFEHLVSLHGE